MRREPLAVMKFGGTSLASPEARQCAADHVSAAIEKGMQVVVVVSAMGRRGDPYATDTLLDLLRATGDPVDARDYDAIFVCGEIISSVVLSHDFKQRGMNSVPLTGGQAGIFTDDAHMEAEIDRIDPALISNYLHQSLVPIVTGCQGIMERNGDFATMGRGGSDTTAVALGEALKARRVEIFTDVEGVGRADPRVVPSAEILTAIDYETMLELANFGAGVVHPRAIRTGLHAGVPIVVRSTFASSTGTEISGVAEPEGIVAVTAVECVGTAPLSESGAGALSSLERERRGLMGIRDAGGAVILGIKGGSDERLRHILEAFGDLEVETQRQCWLTLVGGGSALQRNAEHILATVGAVGIAVCAYELSGRRLTVVIPGAANDRLIQRVYDQFVSPVQAGHG